MYKLLLFGLCFALSHSLIAEDDIRGREDYRQKKQNQRIKNGIESGQLNQREANRLRRQGKLINKMEDRFESDGEVSKWEKKKLDKMQDRRSRNIYKQKHDGQQRGDFAKRKKNRLKKYRNNNPGNSEFGQNQGKRQQMRQQMRQQRRQQRRKMRRQMRNQNNSRAQGRGMGRRGRR